jgi:hypothetical protein
MPSYYDLLLLGTKDGVYYGNSNDIAYDDGNDLVMITGVQRTRQKVVKILLTVLGANAVYPGYGSILALLKNSRTAANLLEQIEDSVVYALTYLQSKEVSTDPSEKIKRIISVTAQNPIDATGVSNPRAFIINIQLELGDGTTLAISV